jgi:hypothetical protein
MPAQWHMTWSNRPAWSTNVGVGNRLRHGVVQARHLRDPAREVAVEMVPVGCRTQQPGLYGRMLAGKVAQCLHHVDPAPARHPLRKPEQRLRASRQPYERRYGEGAESA